MCLSYICPDLSSKQLTQVDTNAHQQQQQGGKKTGDRNKRGKENESLLVERRDQQQLQQPTLVFYTEPYKVSNEETVFVRLVDAIVDQFTNTSIICWLSMAESGVQCVFKLADRPIEIVESILSRLMDKQPLLRALMNNGDQLASDDQLTGSYQLLTRFINMLGIVATKLLVFLNQTLVCELKRRKMIKESKSNIVTSKTSSKQQQQQAAKNRRKSARKSINIGDHALEEEMGLQGAEAEDAEQLLVEQIIEQKVAKNSLIAMFAPMLVFVLRDPGTFADDSLQLACACTLVRIMMLSKRLCEEHIQLLFTLMEKSSNTAVRSQLIVGIGDLVYRFPNSLERWTNHLYLPLRDTSSELVRLNTLRVLSHLILKELIKTRGQIYEIALCTIDPEQSITALAKLFFQVSLRYIFAFLYTLSFLLHNSRKSMQTTK